MWKWVLASGIICLLAGSVRADACPPRRSAPPNRVSDWSKVLYKLQGRLLVNFIRGGMTDEEIVRMLGVGDKPLPTGGLVSGVLFVWRRYDNYGFTVSFVGDNTGVLRVRSVTFRPLFD